MAMGRIFEIGGGTELANIALVRLICSHLDDMAPNLPVRSAEKLITFVKDRPGHDFRYAIQVMDFYCNPEK